MTIFRGTELIMLLQVNDYLSTLQTFPLLCVYGSLFYAYYIKIIKNGGWEHQACQLLKNR